MKVLHIIKTNTGASWAYKQIREQKKIGVDITVMMPNDCEGFALEYKKINVDVIKFDASLPVKKPWTFFKKRKQIIEIINTIKPDIIHCHFVTNIMFVRLSLRNTKIPRLFQVPGPLHLENIFFKYAEIMLKQKNDYWAGSCKKTCEIYEKAGIPKDKIFFGYYAGEFNEYAKKAERTGKLRKEFNIAEEDFLIGTVSYLYKPKYYMLKTKGIKGHEDFIDAFAILRKKHNNVKAIIIGGPAPKSEKYMERIKKRAMKKCGNDVIFTGFKENIIELYKDLDLVIHPSRSENYGGCGESLAVAVPTITSNIGGFPDFIKEGQTGYLFKVKDTKNLADKMEYVMEHYDEAKETAINGQKFIVNINSKLSAEQALDIYNKILEREEK